MLLIIQLQKYGYLKSLNGEGVFMHLQPLLEQAHEWIKSCRLKQLQEPLIANHA